MEDVVSPIQGRVAFFQVDNGDEVERGKLIAIITNSKNEKAIFAPISGIVYNIKVCVGERVSSGESLLKIA